MSLLAFALSVVMPAAAASPSPAAGLVAIGSAAAIRGRVEALHAAPGAVGRILGSGEPVYLDDKITTGPTGRLQVLLRDETIFTIGPNTTLVLDKFVYDPSSGLGEVSASVTEGVFRFITGKVAKKQPSNMRVKLPVCTIGIHGTDVAGLAGPNQATVVLKWGAGITVSNDQGAVDINRPNFGTTVLGGQAPSASFAASRDLLESLRGALSPITFAARTEPAPPPAQGPGPAQPPADPTPRDLRWVNVVMGQAAQDNSTNLQSSLVEGAASSWDDVRRLAGTGTYSAVSGSVVAVPGSWSCTAVGACSWSFTINADFASRTMTAGSFASVVDNERGPRNIDYTNLTGTSWANLSGAATLEIPMSGLVNYGGNFNYPNGCNAAQCNYDFTFQNHNNAAAGQIQGSVELVDVPMTAKNNNQTLIAPRQ